MIQSERTTARETDHSTRYYITNLRREVKDLLPAIRAHGVIESAHGTLDVTFEEDDRIGWSRTRAHKESIGKRLRMNMLKQFRETFTLFPKRKEKMSYEGIQSTLFARDNDFEAFLRKSFK